MAWAAARRFRDEANRLLQRAGVRGCLYGRSIVHLYLGPVRSDAVDLDYFAPSADTTDLIETRFDTVQERLSLHLLQRGVATLRGSMFVFSAVHTEADIDQTLAAFEDSLNAMVAEGAMPSSLRAD